MDRKAYRRGVVILDGHEGVAAAHVDRDGQDLPLAHRRVVLVDRRPVNPVVLLPPLVLSAHDCCWHSWKNATQMLASNDRADYPVRVGVRVQEADERPSLGMIVRVDLISGMPPVANEGNTEFARSVLRLEQFRALKL